MQIRFAAVLDTKLLLCVHTIWSNYIYCIHTQLCTLTWFAVQPRPFAGLRAGWSIWGILGNGFHQAVHDLVCGIILGTHPIISGCRHQGCTHPTNTWESEESETGQEPRRTRTKKDQNRDQNQKCLFKDGTALLPSTAVHYSAQKWLNLVVSFHMFPKSNYYINGG